MPKIRARYRVTGPHNVQVTYTKAVIDKELKSMNTETVTEEKKMFMVYFPQGHSIRVDEAELKRLGYHKRPRLVDLETGDIIDTGGDPYDLENVRDEISIDELIDTGDEDDITITKKG